MEIEVSLLHPSLAVDGPSLELLLRRVLTEEGVRQASVSVVLADRALVLRLNRTYLAHDFPTDVLAFNLDEASAPERVEGEVYVDLDTAAERHAEFGSSFEEEVRRYAVHGLLHLIGYDDADDAQKRRMHALEDRYLAAGSRR